MAMIGTETVLSSPKFNEIIIEFFKDWKQAFVHLYSQICDPKQAEIESIKSIIMIEGAVLMMRIHNNPDYLTHVQESLLAQFKEVKNKVNTV